MASTDSPDQPKTRPNETVAKPFKWSSKSERAAVLVAEDALTDQAIANDDGVKVAKATLERWKKHPEFSARVTEHVAQLRDRALRSGLARLDRRLARYEKRAAALDLIVEERAAEPAMQDVPGGKSGYLVRQYKNITVTFEPPRNEDGEIEEGAEPVMVRQQLEEYHFDAALEKAQRELDKQVSIEAGQWAEKREVTGPDGSALRIEVVYADLDAKSATDDPGR